MDGKDRADKLDKLNRPDKADKKTGADRAYQAWMGPSFSRRFSLSYGPSQIWLGHDPCPVDLEACLAPYHRQMMDDLGAYIEGCPAFSSSLSPLPLDPQAPALVQAMLRAGRLSGTGPMASVAGLLAQALAQEARRLGAGDLVVENGGDIFFYNSRPLDLALYGGPSPLGQGLAIRLPADKGGWAVSSSSASFGHGLSLGRAHLVTVVGRQGALTDAFATSICNQTESPAQTRKLIESYIREPSIDGLVAMVDDQLLAVGQIEFVPFLKGAHYE